MQRKIQETFMLKIMLNFFLRQYSVFRGCFPLGFFCDLFLLTSLCILEDLVMYSVHV